jgi:hypothetical protein
MINIINCSQSILNLLLIIIQHKEKVMLKINNVVKY